MIRLERTDAECQSCGSSGIRVIIASQTGSGVSRVSCRSCLSVYTRIPPTPLDRRCTSCGQRRDCTPHHHTDGYHQVRETFALCPTCWGGFERIAGDMINQPSLDASEFDDTWAPPTWWSSSELAKERANRKGRR